MVDSLGLATHPGAGVMTYSCTLVMSGIKEAYWGKDGLVPQSLFLVT